MIVVLKFFFSEEANLVFNDNNSLFQIKAKIKCYCYTCAVTSIAWTPTNKLISGCSYGWVCTWTSNLECTSYIKLHAGEIINVKLSISSNYVVTTGVDGVLNLLTPSSKKILMKRKCLLPIKVSISLFCLM